MTIAVIIPSRYESTRFPGKPLADLAGKPMIQHVYERVLMSGTADLAAVATDDPRIFAAVEAFGGRAVMTADTHRSGSDRIAEAAGILGLREDDIVVNVQGDQPVFEPVQIDEVVAPLVSDPSLPMSTLIYRIRRDEEITHPNAVKTVFDGNGNALYFSRATIPFVRDRGRRRTTTSTTASTPTGSTFSTRSPDSPRGPWSASNPWSSSGPWNRATASGSWSRNTTPSKWTTPRSWTGSGGSWRSNSHPEGGYKRRRERKRWWT